MMWRLGFVLIAVLSVIGGVRGESSKRQEAEGFNPQSILVSNFIFTLPKNWEWMETRTDIKNVVEAARFRIDDHKHCQAFFASYEPGNEQGQADTVARRWKEWFHNPRGELAFGAPTTIGEHTVSFLRITGTFKGEPPQKGLSLHNYILCGAIIERPEGNLVLRLNGPPTIMVRAEADFRKMVEQALKPE